MKSGVDQKLLTWEDDCHNVKFIVLQVPFYKGEHIRFDVAPGKLDFHVPHSPFTIPVRNICIFLFY